MSLRWGIMGTGHISSDFTAALISMNAKVSAIGASSISKAQEFARTFSIEHVYGSYEDLAGSPHVDVVYIGTIHPLHKENAMLCLDNGKHVLVEKPIALNAKEAQEMIDHAREKKLFLMEGMWTRCFPAVRQAKAWIDSGEIGDIKAVLCDFGLRAGEGLDEERQLELDLGGGATLDIGVYPIAAAFLAFGRERPTRIAATGLLADTGADTTVSVSLQFERGIASLAYSIDAEAMDQTAYIGTEGIIRFPKHAHCPTSVIMERSPGKDAPKKDDVKEKRAIEYPLAKNTAAISMNYWHSEGFAYEIDAVQQSIRRGETECPEFTLEDSLIMIETTDEIRRQLGVRYATD